jgi:SAM-dependent methyltransferase
MTWLGRLYIWATYRLYNELAWAYDLVSWVVSFGRWSGWRLSALDYLAGQRVLEIGFGTGELLAEMAACGLKPLGMDLSLAMHRVTGRKLASRALDASRLRGDALRMPFPDQCFDSLISTFPAGYILQGATLREAARVLCLPDPIKSQEAGRLVVVGVEVWIGIPACQRVMEILLGSRSGAAQERFVRLAQDAGLSVRIVDHGSGLLRLPVLVAEKRPKDVSLRESGSR